MIGEPKLSHTEVVFELHDKGIYVNDTGALQSRLLPGQIVETTQQRARNFLGDVVLNVGGVQLQTYGGDYKPPDLADVFGLSKDVKDSLALIAQAYAILAGGVGIALAIPAALKLAGLVEEDPNPFDVLFDRIDQKLSAILAATLAGSKLSTKLNMRDLIGHSETSAAIAAKHIAKGYPTNPASTQRLGHADYFSKYAVTTLAGDEYWLRVYDEKAIQGAWTWGIKERAALIDGSVWDYRLAFPAFAKALFARLVVIKALDKNHHLSGSYRDEILGYANFLRKVEGRVRSGIARAVLPIGEQHYPFMAKFQAQPCGVADLHSGLSDYLLWDAWGPSDDIDVIALTNRGGYPNNFKEYYGLHETNTELRFWRLYKWIGMFSLWQITPDVESLAGPANPPEYIWVTPNIYAQATSAAPPFPKMLTQLYTRSDDAVSINGTDVAGHARAGTEEFSNALHRTRR